jgi:hypothetical protein
MFDIQPVSLRKRPFDGHSPVLSAERNADMQYFSLEKKVNARRFDRLFRETGIIKRCTLSFFLG